MVAKIIQALLFLLFCAGMSSALTYTVAYRNLAQTITVQHTFNPTAAGAPFVIGSNAAEVEVTNLRAEKMTSLAANPTNCATGIMSGVDASGNAESCTTIEIDTSGGLMRYPINARNFTTIFNGAGWATEWGNDVSTDKPTANNAASDTEPTSNTFSTTLNANSYGLSTVNEIFRVGNEITGVWGGGMGESGAGIVERRFWIGFTGAAIGTLRGSDTPAGSTAAFRWHDTVDTNWQCFTGDTTTTHAEDSGIAVDTAFHEFRIVLNAAKTSAKFYIDDVLVCEKTVAEGNPIPGTVANENLSSPFTGLKIAGVGTASARLAYEFVSVD